MDAQSGDLILVAGEKIAVVRSVETNLKGANVFHTTLGDYKAKDVLAIYRPVYKDTTPEKEPDSNMILARAIEKLTARVK